MGVSELKEIILLKSKKQEEEFKKIIEKNRNKTTGLIGKLKGIEEEVEVNRKLFSPYWLLKYTYSQKKGFFKKKLVESDNLMVVNGFSGVTCTDETSIMGFRKIDILTALLNMEKEKIKITTNDKVLPTLSLDEVIKRVKNEVSATQERIGALLYEADMLGRQILPDCTVLDELKSRARYINNSLQALVNERQVKAVFEVARGGVRTLTGGRAGLDSIRDGIRHGLWSGRTGGSNPVEGFITQCLNPRDIEAMDEAELRGLLEEVNALIIEYSNQLEPYLRKVEGMRADAYALKEKLRASTNLPKKAENIIDYRSGELIFYPYRCIKYKGVDRKGKAITRWLVLNGINGDICKGMNEKIEQFVSYLS